MASSSFQSIDLSPEPDLHPLYPTPASISVLLSSHSGLAPSQRAELVTHCINRACVFGDLQVIQYLLSDHQTHAYLDLGIRDEDGIGLVSLAIQGFGAESDRDVEREECVRLLIAQGADLSADNAGWTPLHHAALLSPPTLISHLMTHGCSPFAVTRYNLTALDVVTAHSILPGREDVALLLEEAMRGEGWTGGRVEEKRRLHEEKEKRKERQRDVRDDVGRVLDVHPQWWGSDSDSTFTDSDEEEDDADDDKDENIYTPPTDYSNMLVFSPPLLPQIFDSLITNFQPSLRNSTPANTLYMLARFALHACDHTWLEDLIVGATDAIEETFFNRAEDVTCLVFWLYNTTLWLHLLQCDNSINEACEVLGSFELIEEVINSVFVFIIRFAERRIDSLLDSTILEYFPSELAAVQFESEWSFLRPFSKKKATSGTSPGSHTSPLKGSLPAPPLSPKALPSPPPFNHTASGPKPFSSLRQTFARSRPSAGNISLLADTPVGPSPSDLTSFLTALHTLLTLAEINPALTTQLWSQVMYWTSCEIFNRIITRKKYLCRSRACQIGMNLSVLEDWVVQMGLPRGVQLHFTPVRDLLNWLQCLSSITEFSDLVATIQSMKSINPLQMRRAVRDYKYEVEEGKMTEECIQYLTQLQKDWERHRVKLGVEALKKEIGERGRDRSSSVSSSINGSHSGGGPVASISPSSSSESTAQQSIDMLFETSEEKQAWEPVKPPQVLGELLDSRYMLPLIFPSDPRMLGALPGKMLYMDDEKLERRKSATPSVGSSSASYISRGSMTWRSRDRKIREVGISTLQWVDGIRSASRWGRPSQDVDDDESEEEDHHPPSYSSDDPNHYEELRIDTRITPLTRKPSTRGKKQSLGETTPI